MDFLTIYSISLLGLPLAVFALIHGARLMRAWLPLAYGAFLRYLLCRAITDRHRLLSPVSRARLLSLILLLGCVVAGTVVDVADLQSGATRAGRLGILLSVFLFASSHFGGLSNALGMALARVKLLHTAIGWMALFEAVFHTAASAQDASLAQRKGLFGLIAGISVCLLTISPIIRKPAYETFYVSHMLLAVLYAISVWYHVADGSILWRWMAVAGPMCLGLTTILRTAVMLYRNININNLGRAYTTIEVSELRDERGVLISPRLIRIGITLPRTLVLHPGQYVYLRVLLLGSNAWLQSHPFVILSWKDLNEPRVTATRELEFIAETRLGLTSVLLPAISAGLAQHTTSSSLAIIDGPYGRFANAADYGTVIMLATGIGIFAQIPHVYGAIRSHDVALSRTKKIVIIWQIGPDFIHLAMVHMKVFLSRELEGISLRVIIVHPGISTMTSSTIDTLPSDRVELRDGDINHELVSESIRLREGRLLVSVSASGSTRDIVRQSIAKAARINNAETIPDIELLELDYQPEEVAGFQTTQPRRNGPEGTMGA